MLSIYFRSTLMQVMVPTDMLGRVSSVNQIFIGSSNEIGAFESGLAARLLGDGPLGGLRRRRRRSRWSATTAWRGPELRRLDRIEADPDAGAAQRPVHPHRLDVGELAQARRPSSRP